MSRKDPQERSSSHLNSKPAQRAAVRGNRGSLDIVCHVVYAALKVNFGDPVQILRIHCFAFRIGFWYAFCNCRNKELFSWQPRFIKKSA